MTGWSLLPEDLLHILSMHLENFFEVVHARSVCSSWRSTLPFPSCLLRQSYSLPAFDFKDLPDKRNTLCTLKNIPLILFRVRAPPSDTGPVYYLGGVDQDESKDHVELPSDIQCSVKVKIQGSGPTLKNMVDCQIVPLGHQYIIIGGTPEQRRNARNISVAFLPLNKESGGDEFVVLIGYFHELFALKSAEMRWVRLRISHGLSQNIVTFRGRFYATFRNGDVFVIDPYTLKGTSRMPPPPRRSIKYLVPSGDDELFLVEKISPHVGLELTLRVSRLDEEVGQWVVVSDLGNRVLFILHLGYFSCSSKELPRDCGVSGNSIVFARHLGYVGHIYKYGVHTENLEDDLNCWRPSRKKRLTVLDRYPALAFKVER